MARMITFSAIAIALPALAGCSSVPRTLDTARLGPAQEIMIYEGGHPVMERKIPEGSEEERAIAAWLRAHPDGWHTDIVTYAPSRRVRGSDFTLDFHTDRCILNYRTNAKGNWAQVSRPLRADEKTPDVFILRP